MADLKSMKVNDLKVIAREKNIKGWWDMKKADLITAIEALAEELMTDETVSETLSEAHEEVEAEDNVNINDNEENVSESTENDETAIKEMNEYGYTDENMIPVSKEDVHELLENDVTVHALYEDNSEAVVLDNKDVENHEGMFGIEKEDAHRKNKKRLIEYNGETKTLTAWAKDLGIRHQTLYNRIVMKGMDPAEAFEMPLKKGKKKEVETA